MVIGYRLDSLPPQSAACPTQVVLGAERQEDIGRVQHLLSISRPLKNAVRAFGCKLQKNDAPSSVLGKLGATALVGHGDRKVVKAGQDS